MKILYALFSYLLGSIPIGYILLFISERKDIRNYGSGATGATNVLRVKGWKYALPVSVLDILKGFVPVFFALKIFENILFAVICAFLSIAGHCFPIYLKFKGGKGVATAAGVFSILAFKPFVLGLVVFILVVVFTRYVSLASILAASSFPFLIYLFKGKVEIIGLSLVIFLLIVLKHWGNIKRLIKGTERKIGENIK